MKIIESNMSKKYNNTGGKKSRNYGGGGGLSKHRSSGTSHNHANSLQRVREENAKLKKEAELREKRKMKNNSVKDLFKGYN